MEISGPQPPPIAASVQITSAQSLVDAWKVGQLVKATVASQPQNGQAAINVGGTVLLAQTQLPLQTGQTLQLAVSSLATLAVLKVISQNSAAPAVTLTLPSQGHVVSQWQAGKVLEAVLLTPSERGTARLNIAGQLIDAKVSLPLPVNQPLKLEIVNPGKIAALQILNTSQGADSLGQALRTALPQQAPLPPLLTTLANIAQSPTSQTQQAQQIPAPIAELARQIIEKLPTPVTLSSAKGVQQAFNQSGLFLEAKISKAMQQTQGVAGLPVANLTGDFKGGLLTLLASLFTLTKIPLMTPLPQQPIPTAQLAQYIQQAMTQGQKPSSTAATQQTQLQQPLIELIRNVESGLARIMLNQFASSASEDEGKRSWVIDIPVRHDQHIDLFQLRIDREESQQNDNKPDTWTVNLAFELQTLGPLQVCITLSNGVINTTFWAEQANTSDLINKHIESLHQRMTDAGLSVGNISAQQGKSQEPITDIPHVPHVLLDVKA